MARYERSAVRIWSSLGVLNFGQALIFYAGTVVIDWLHAEGFAVRTVVSNALLLRATDPILLISITDITELMWTS